MAKKKGKNRTKPKPKIGIPVVGTMVAVKVGHNLLQRTADVITPVMNKDFAGAWNAFNQNISAHGLESAIFIGGYGVMKRYLPRSGVNVGPIRLTL